MNKKITGTRSCDQQRPKTNLTENNEHSKFLKVFFSRWVQTDKILLSVLERSKLRNLDMDLKSWDKKVMFIMMGEKMIQEYLDAKNEARRTIYLYPFPPPRWALAQRPVSSRIAISQKYQTRGDLTLLVYPIV